MTQAKFQKVYKQLNPAQKQAVDTIDGPVMVVAGPGTGKTQVLAARIANILRQTDTDPQSILALTFTQSAAQNMRQRLVEMIGRAGYYVNITTFHSFCSEVIQTHPEYFPIGRGSEPLTDLEKFDLFRSILIDTKLEKIKPLNRPLFYLSEVIDGISNLKREGLGVEDFAQLLLEEEAKLDDAKKEKLTKTELRKLEKNLAKQQELLKVYKLYQERLRAGLRYDFDDMISLVLEAFVSEEDLLLDYQEKLHYFLVDEYQDTNSAQNKVVNLLASYWGESANIFVVGDPNQAIYRFQGASIENVLSFLDVYSRAQIVNLDLGYRCPQPVYDAAAGIIKNNQLSNHASLKGLEDPLKSHNKLRTKIQTVTADSQFAELVYIAEQIAKLQKEGVPAENIAVLFRYNRDADQLQEVLDKYNLIYEVDGGSDVLSNQFILQFLMLLQVIRQVQLGENPEELFEVLLFEWLGMDSVLVMKAARLAGKQRLSLAEFINLTAAGKSSSSLSKKTKADALSLTELEVSALKNSFDQISNWAVRDAQLPLVHFFEEVLNQSGFLDWVTKGELKTELLIHLNSLFREVKALAAAKPGASLETFLRTIDIMNEFGISLRAEDLNIRQSAIHLSTVHKAKGREWDYVFVIHCSDGKWGNVRQRNLLPLPESILEKTDISKKELNEDERRLFYVAMTRAKKQVTISHSLSRVTINKSQEEVPSMFIQELREVSSNLDEVRPDLSSEVDEMMLGLLQPTQTSFLRIDQKEFFQKILENFKLSVTHLNSYLRDPQEFVENHLLKVPRTTPEPLAFGSAVHAALEKFSKDWVETHTKPELKKLLEVFEKTLVSQLLPTADLERRLKYGQEVLTKYYQDMKFEDSKVLMIERFFGSGWSRTFLGDIPLVGRVDRIDWLDTKDKTVTVVDYKTGKPKSKNFIEGKLASQDLSVREQELPENIRGPYKRQLLFYKLLTDLDPSFVPTTTQGIFEFVEPNNSGKIVTRKFELKDEDVADLKKLIKEVYQEIMALKFLET